MNCQENLATMTIKWPSMSPVCWSATPTDQGTRLVDRCIGTRWRDIQWTMVTRVVPRQHLLMKSVYRSANLTDHGCYQFIRRHYKTSAKIASQYCALSIIQNHHCNEPVILCNITLQLLFPAVLYVACSCSGDHGRGQERSPRSPRSVSRHHQLSAAQYWGHNYPSLIPFKPHITATLMAHKVSKTVLLIKYLSYYIYFFTIYTKLDLLIFLSLRMLVFQSIFKCISASKNYMNVNNKWSQ